MKQAEADPLAVKLHWRILIFLAIGLLLIGWLVDTPPGILGKADAIGYAVCHRIDIRSFHIGAQTLPLCARCTGMYLGAMLGLVFQAVIGKKRTGIPPLSVIIAIGLFVVAFGVDGLNSYLHFFPGAPSLYEPQNLYRLITGTGMGLAISTALFPAFNQTIWRDVSGLPAISGWKPFLALIVLSIGLDALVLTGNPYVLYPLALISAAGVLVLLTMVYTMAWLMLLRKENLAYRLTQLVVPLTGGLTAALLQIVLLDLARYVLTGTWDGFHLG